MKEPIKEPQQVAFRKFIENAEKLLAALQSGKYVDQIARDCKEVCNNSCNCNDCKIHGWLSLLIEARNKELFPCDTTTFVEYIIATKSSSKTFFSVINHYLLKFTLMADFEMVKSKIIEELEYGFSINCIINELETFEDDSETIMMKGWLNILSTAVVQKLIPCEDLKDFLKFI